MPNWCDNSLTISGAKADIERLRNEYFTGDDLDFEKVLATPEFKPTDTYSSRLFGLTDVGEECWYHWRLDNWGTKWPVEDSETVFSETEIETRFETAWSPPSGIYETLRSRYPVELHATFYESGMCFAGAYVNGDFHEFQIGDPAYDIVASSFGDEPAEEVP